MKKLLAFACAALAASALAPSPAAAVDVWDRTGNDDDTATESELVPGSSEVHDMEAVGGVADQDWFRFRMEEYSSYEVVVDGTSAGLATVPVTAPGDELAVDLMTLGNALPWKTSRNAGAAGAVRSLTMTNLVGLGDDDLWIRVSSPQCDTACGPDEQYRIRLLETTLALPRFNNSASQVTLLIVQNLSDHLVSFQAWLFDWVGAPIGTAFYQIQPRGVIVWDTREASGGAGAGRSGSIRVTHDGRYGDVVGKAVALEPATGFTFDTALVPRPQ
jgi:hypothetical protein